MPNAITNAVCGPQIANTKRPTDGTTLSNLNPCPLNVCCNVWGQCGTLENFCTIAFTITGLAGNAALSIAEIIENPESAPMAIAGMLFAGRIKSPKEYNDFAKVRNSMSTSEIGKMGSIFKKNDDYLRRAINTCKA